MKNLKWKIILALALIANVCNILFLSAGIVYVILCFIFGGLQGYAIAKITQ